MPKLLYNRFQQVEFSDEEKLSAYCFSDLQIQHIQNEAAKYAELLIKTQVNPQSLNMNAEYLTEKAFNLGAMAALEFLLTTHQSMFDSLVSLRQTHQAKD